MAERRVLVTGATGLIGRHVVTEMIARGWQVHAATRSLAHDVSNGEVRWHKANLFDTRERIQLLDSAEPDAIVHCAWVTEHGAYWTSPENLDWVAATMSLAREGHERNVRRFVGVGTCAEYASNTAGPLVEATSPAIPATLYGIAKDSARRVLEAFGETSHLSVAWTRVAMLYGAGEHKDRFVASLARALIKGEPARMSSGKAVRDFLDARDVGAAIATVASSPLTGAVNIGSGAPLTLLEVGQALARLAGTPQLLQPGALPDRAGEPAALIPDVTRLTREAGFTPRIPFEQGLRDVLGYWRRELHA